MDIGEAINVIASFGMPYKIKPLKFKWSGRLFEIKEITYLWKSREGRAEIYHFSVSDGKALYELTFDTGSLLWRLERLEA
ncbi:MAG: hypothetical protein HZC10_09385 [Nitrospirae bacterium]|nr:hypothetical protein [Nitrospirota bacterium]